MKTNAFAAATAILLLTACAATTGPHTVGTVMPASALVNPLAANANDAFSRHAATVLDEMWRHFPESAFNAGYYKYADQLTVPDAAQRARDVDFYTRQLAALSAFDPQQLSASHRVDLELMKNAFESRRWSITTFQPWRWQPSRYNVGGDIGRMLASQYAPLESRLRHILAKLGKVPAYYAAAKANISEPTLEHTQLARIQNKGALTVLGGDLTAKVAQSGLTADEKALFQSRLSTARAAVQDYLTTLETLEAKLTKEGARSFRIGKALYDQKFAYDIQSGWTADALYQKALQAKAEHHDAMEKLARELWPKYVGNKPMPTDRLELIRVVIDALSLRHTTREKFAETIRQQIPELERFVREKDLVDQDPTRPLVVRDSPAYMRGSGAGASINAPGPYDPVAETYYNVEPLDGFTDAEAESYLREYNDWMLQILNIHEAIPGHYTQLMHANKSKSLIKSLFGNGSMIEGWAVFSEKVMLDAGYGNNAPEMWLIWRKWNLRSVVNTILDYEIQTKNLSRDAAITMMTREAFQQQTEATEKWRRATFTQVQLTSYFNGYAEITALRDEERARRGSAFSVKAFNNQFLSYGNAPVKSIRELMREGK